MHLPGSRKVSVDSSATMTMPSKAAVKGMDRIQKTVIALLATSNLFSGVTFSCIVPFFPTLARSKGMSTSQVGLVIGIFQLSTFFISPIFGKYMIILCTSRVFIGGLSLTSLCTIILGYSQSIPFGTPFFVAVLVLRIGQAVGNAAYCTSSWSIIGRLFPERIAMMTGVLEVSYGLGFTIGPIVGSALYELGGFGIPLYAIGLLYMLVIIPSVMFFRRGSISIENSGAKETTEAVPKALKLLTIPDLLLAIISLFLCCFCWCFYEPSLTDYMSTFDAKFWSPSMLSGLMMSLVSFTYLIFAPIWGFLLDRYLSEQTAPIMMGGSAGMIVATMLMGPSPLLGLPKSLFITGFSFGLLGIVGGMAYVPVFKWCIDAAKKKGFSATSPGICGCISGFMQSALSLGAFLATSLGGLSAQNIGFPWTATLIAGLHGSFIIVQIIYRLHQRFFGRNRHDVVSPTV